jgi:hypothetical protein
MRIVCIVAPLVGFASKRGSRHAGPAPRLAARAGRLLVVAAVLFTAGLLPRPAYASTVLYRTDAQLVALSDRVVHARVLTRRFERPGGGSGAIYTVSTLAVLEDFTGVPGDTLEVWEMGGVFGGEAMLVGGAVQYEIGSEVLVCLGRGRLGLRSVAMGFSKFDVAPVAAADGSMDGRLTRNMRDTAVVGGAPQGRERSLSEFRALVSAVRGVRSLRNSAADSLVPDQRVSDAFTLLTFGNGLGARWVEADAGTPDRYFRNASQPSPLLSGNIDTEILKSLSAWTSPTSASITLQYAGTTVLADPYLPVSGNSDGTAVISFEDPNDELMNPTLAVGGGYASTGGGVVSGTTFNRFTRAYVIFQNAADLPSSFRSPQDFSRVLEHEVGHTIGLGHATDPAAIMYPSCCSTATPIAPALGADDLAGLNFIYPSPSVVTCSPSVSPSSVYITAQPATGTINIIAPAGCSWTATSNASFVTLSASGGTGNSTLTYTVTANPSPNVRIATLTIAGQTFTITQAAAVPDVTPPFGVVDTPLDNATGVTGSIPVTGWALDDVQVASVKIYRDPVAGETQGILVYIGDAAFVPGARPDVAAAYPSAPFNTQAGWGYLLLTNVLPNTGTGTYRLHMYATDSTGNQTLLGSRLITCTNSTAVTPFGAIDTPAPQEVISSATYNDFGWVLSLGPRRADPPGGGTVRVVIDGAVVGSPSGWTSRSDLSALFPVAQYPGVNTALAVHSFSTTGLANGLHTIAWSVTDNLGGAAGVGSRYFTVSKSLPLAALAEASTLAAEPGGLPEAPLESVAITGRRGFGFDAPLRRFRPDAAGRVTVQGEEVDRIELHLAGPATEGRYAGYLRAGGALTPLPIGSSLEPATGDFTWQPGVAFVGPYDFVFVRSSDGHAVARQEVRIVLNPKASDRVGPQVVIDTPGRQQDVGQPFVLAGWAIDLDDEVGTGIDALHVWAYPLAGGDPIFVGTAAYGGARPDVAALHGERFKPSGYSLTVGGLAPGNYDLAVFPWSTAAGGFVQAKTVRVTVR